MPDLQQSRDNEMKLITQNSVGKWIRQERSQEHDEEDSEACA
jgi:hypothetical protein